MGRPVLWRRCVVSVCSFFVIVLMVAVGAGTIWLRIRNHDHPPPRFYAAILNAHLSRPSPEKMVSTSFALSLGVAALPGHLLTGGGYCLDRGTVVQVSHGGKTLARAVVAGWEAVCASWWMPPGNARWTKVVARGNNITTFPVNARRGVQVFDMSLQIADGKTTAWCAARQVGDDDKAAAACNVHYSST